MGMIRFLPTRRPADVDELTELREEVEYLRRQLGLAVETAWLVRVMDRGRLTANQARLVLALYRARAGVLTEAQLEEATERYEANRPLCDSLVKVLIHNVRRRHGWGVIETVRGVGYRLSPAGRRWVTLALGEPR